MDPHQSNHDVDDLDSKSIPASRKVFQQSDLPNSPQPNLPSTHSAGSFFRRKPSVMTLEGLRNFVKNSFHHMSVKKTGPDDVVEVHRPVYNLDNFDMTYGYAHSSEPFKAKIIRHVRKQCTCSKARLWSMFVSFFPFLTWMKEYNWKIDSINDLMAGITVGIMSIPQGMSYAGLVGVPPQYGLYTNLVPTIVYFFVGSSRHAAIGTVAVVSLMMGTIRFKLIPDKSKFLSAGCDPYLKNISWNSSMSYDLIDKSIFDSPDCYTAPELAMATSMLSGLFLMLMGFLRLGFVSSYLSDYLVGGFTSGAAIFVFTSQLDYIFGFHLTIYSGPGKIFKTYIELFTRIKETNPATITIAIICAACLLIVKEVLSPRFQKKFKVPIPGELLAVVIGTLASYFGHFHQQWNVIIVNDIPAGFPSPRLARFDIMYTVFVDALVLAIVNYSLSVSLAKLYAKRNNYKIDPYQEFFAYSLINILGSTFQSFPSGQSVARSIVYESAGAKSQFAGLIGTVCVVICILWLAPFLAALPQCVLGAVIIVACFEMLQQMKQLKPLWKASKIDFSIYLVTFIAVVLLDVTYGLAVSVLYAFLTVIVRTQCPRVIEMGRIGETDLYNDVASYQRTSQLPGVKVFHYHAPLYYANVENFRLKVYKLCNVDPAVIRAEQQKKEQKEQKEQKLEKKRARNGLSESPAETLSTEVGKDDHTSIAIDRPHHVIIDCSGFSYVDVMGVNALKLVYTELRDTGIVVYYADCNGSVRKILDTTKFYETVPKTNLFVSVHDAVLEASKLRAVPIREIPEEESSTGTSSGQNTTNPSALQSITNISTEHEDGLNRSRSVGDQPLYDMTK